MWTSHLQVYLVPSRRREPGLEESLSHAMSLLNGEKVRTNNGEVPDKIYYKESFTASCSIRPQSKFQVHVYWMCPILISHDIPHLTDPVLKLHYTQHLTGLILKPYVSVSYTNTRHLVLSHFNTTLLAMSHTDAP